MPQGLIAGLLLFDLHIADVANTAQLFNVHVHCNATYNHMYTVLSLTLQQFCRGVIACIEEINQWMGFNHLNHNSAVLS